MPQSFDDGAFSILFTVAAVFIGIVFVLVIVLAVRNARKLRASGIDPTTAGADLAVRLMRSGVLSGQRPTEERLAELDRLLAAGTITRQEYDVVRLEVLKGA